MVHTVLARAGSFLAVSTLVVAGLFGAVVTAPSAEASSATVREKAVKVAQQQHGDPYKLGAVGPNAFDCSGLVQYSFKAAGKTLPRTAEQLRTGLPTVAKNKKVRGDLIVFTNSAGRATHVGIYVGNNKIVHSSRPGKPVRTSAIYTERYTVKRVV